MRRTEIIQEIRKKRFEEDYWGWSESRLTQEQRHRSWGYVIGRFVGTSVGTKTGGCRVCRTSACPSLFSFV